MFSRDYYPPTLQHDFEAWRETFRLISGRYNPQLAGEGNFLGWARAFSGFGFQATDIACDSVERGERTHHDARVDGQDELCAVIQIAGSLTVSQNNHIVQMTAGDVILHDMSRPMAVHCEGHEHWFSLLLPRQNLISHLGFAPVAGPRGQGGARAGRLLLEIALSALHGEDVTPSPGDAYLQLAIYDLVGALFAKEAWPSLRPTDKLFNRLRRIVDNNFTDPDFGPQELADEARISLRYVHKLFGERGSACAAHIYARRLDHAAQLLRRRASLGTRQSIAEISYACGFRDQTHFTRKFRRRFGCKPGDYCLPYPKNLRINTTSSLQEITSKPCLVEDPDAIRIVPSQPERT
jgi:AraC family transcriptional activator of tynA and feaB